MQYMRSVTLYLITHYQLGLPWSAPDICLYRPWLALGLHFCLFLTCLFITDSSLNSDYVSAYVIVLDLIASYQPGLTDFTLCLSFCPTGISSLQSSSHTPACTPVQITAYVTAYHLPAVPVIVPRCCSIWPCLPVSSLLFIIYGGEATQCWLIQICLSTCTSFWQ